MDRGAVIAQSDEHEKRIRSLANHGRSAHYSHDHIGWSSRMSTASAHFLGELLQHATAIVEDRRATAQRYQQAAAGWKRVRCYRAPAGVVENGYLNVLECLEHPADQVSKRFAEQKIDTRRTYPETMDQQKPAAGRFVTGSELTRSRAFVGKVLNLPLYYGMPAEQQTAVVEAASGLFA